ncbi:MAG TPA: T9SS type A sorting domain-containing protein [Bacteroidales bacterium]|nr:T9SS type A sorting domain-containing protein [Bacteroidales bacterium]
MRIVISILILLLFGAATKVQAQNKTVTSAGLEKTFITDESEVDLKIFPVPVLNNRFTVTSDKSFVSIRMTNIIGQEVTREKFNFPQYRTEITFTNAEKGIYLITIEFDDKTKMVRKILVDTSK